MRSSAAHSFLCRPPPHLAHLLGPRTAATGLTTASRPHLSEARAATHRQPERPPPRRSPRALRRLGKRGLWLAAARTPSIPRYRTALPLSALQPGIPCSGKERHDPDVPGCPSPARLDPLRQVCNGHAPLFSLRLCQAVELDMLRCARQPESLRPLPSVPMFHQHHSQMRELPATAVLAPLPIHARQPVRTPTPDDPRAQPPNHSHRHLFRLPLLLRLRSLRLLRPGPLQEEDLLTLFGALLLDPDLSPRTAGWIEVFSRGDGDLCGGACGRRGVGGGAGGEGEGKGGGTAAEVPSRG